MLKIVGILASLLVTIEAPASCLTHQATSDPYDYIVTYIDSLAHAQEAYAVVEAVTANAASSPFDLMVALKKSEMDLDCAQSLVAPYGSSSVDVIKAHAFFAATNYGLLVTLHERYADLVKEAIDGAPKGESPGSEAERLASFSAVLEDTWKKVMTAAATATQTIVEEDPATGKLRLSLNETQRQELLKKLPNYFGETIKQGPKDGQTWPQGAAAMIYEFLAKKDWESRDAK